MPDREKVIKGLECCTTAIGCYECPYAVGGKATNACNLLIDRDALALLKAQEARVMTLEEVKEGEPYFLEMRGIASEYAICKMNDHGDSAFLDFAVQYGDKTLESDGYGKTWRCWTSRPTDEQREKEPWNGCTDVT